MGIIITGECYNIVLKRKFPYEICELKPSITYLKAINFTHDFLQILGLISSTFSDKERKKEKRFKGEGRALRITPI